MSSEIAGLADGLNKAIQQYLGTAIQVQQNRAQQSQEFAMKRQQSDYENKLMIERQGQQQNAELERQQKLKSFEQTLEGDLSPEQADSLIPGASEWVNEFKSTNGRLPKLAEGIKALAETRKQDTKSQRRGDMMDRTVLNYSEKMEKHPLLMKMKDQSLGLEAAQQLNDLAKAGNTVATSALGLKMAKAMGEVGALTENDVTRYVASGQLTRRAGDRLSRWIAGKPTDATLDEIKQIGPVIQQTFSAKTQGIYDTYINRLSANLNISKEEAARRLDVPYAGNVKGKPAGAASKASSSADADPLGLGL